MSDSQAHATFPSKIKSLIVNITHFLQSDLWEKDTSALPVMRRFLFSVCRIVLIVIRGFQQDACSLQASALTYITLVSLVPMLAIMFSFTKGIGMQKELLRNIGVERILVVQQDTSRKKWIYVIEGDPLPADVKPLENSHPTSSPVPPKTPEISPNNVTAQKLPPPLRKALINILSYVENTNFAALGIIGSLLLLFSVICSIAKLENSFNAIWGVKRARPFLRKCSEYLVILILVPLILMLATSMNSMLLTNKFILFLNAHCGSVSIIIQNIVRLISILFIFCGFGFFYMFMPNTKVKFLPAFAAGFISALLWFGVQWAYLHLQVGLTKFNTIYGTFAVLPFFLAWLYANWSIILFGAEISFAIQNNRTYPLEKDSENAPTSVCLILGELILFETCKAFHNGHGGWSPIEYGLQNSIPTRLLRHVTDVLVQNHLLVKVFDSSPSSETYLPGKDIACLSPADVEEAFRQTQSLDSRIYLNSLPQSLRSHFEKTYISYKENLSTMTFDKLTQESPSL